MADERRTGRYEFVLYRVADAMKSDPVVVTAGTALAEAAVIFDAHDFNGLPVVDGVRLLGFFTKLDLLKAFVFTPDSVVPHYDEIVRQPVGNFMSTPPTTVDPDTPLTRVLQQMIDTRCKSFPVVRGDRLVGIIAREDILAALRRAVRGEAASR